VNKKLIRSLLICVVLISSNQATAQTSHNSSDTYDFPDSNLQFLGDWGYSSQRCVESYDVYAFISEGNILGVYQTHNPNNITLTTNVTCRGAILDLTCGRRALYTAEGDAGISTIAINNTSTIGRVSTLNPGGAIVSLDSRDDILIAGAEDGRVYVLDITDYHNPVVAGFVGTPDGQLEKVVLGESVLVAKCNGGVYYFDLDSDLHEHIHMDFNRSAVVDLAYWEESLFLARDNMTIDIVDISSPDSIHVVETIYTHTPVSAMFIEGDNLYLSVEDGHLDIYNLQDSLATASPISIPNLEQIQDIAITRTNVLLASSPIQGTSLIELSLGVNLSTVGYCSTPGEGLAMTLEGDRVYLADGMGMTIVNISEPEYPEVVSNTHLGMHMIDVFIDGDNAFVAAELDGLFILDISDEEDPQVVGNYMGEGEAMDVAVRGDYAYLASGGMGCRVIDISDPAAPFEHGSLINEWEMSFAVEIQDTLLACGGDGILYIYDVSDPGDPILLSNSITAFEITDIQFYNEEIYLASIDGFKIIDIQNLQQVQELTSWEYFGEPMFGNVHVTGYRSYLTTTEAIEVVNCEDLANPYSEGTIQVEGLSDVASSGSYLFISEFGNFNVMGPGHYNLLDQRGGPFHARDMAIEGTHALIAADDAGIINLDISRPGNISEREFDFDYDAVAVAREGDYAYVMSANGTFRAIGLGETYIYMLGGADLGVSSDGFALDVKNDIAVVGSEEGHIQFLDVSSRYNIELLGDLEVPTSSTPEVKVLDNMAIIATENEIFSVSLTSLEVPEVINHSVLDGEVIAISNAAFFTLSKNTRLSTYEWAEDGTHTKLYSELDLGFQPDIGYADGNNLYLGTSNVTPGEKSGVIAIDVSDLRDPLITGGANFLGGIGAISSQDSLVYISTLTDELIVLANQGYAPVSIGQGVYTPYSTVLSQNYPNPFNPSTTLAYELSNYSKVELIVYDVSGREMQTIVSGTQAPGKYTAIWNGLNEEGHNVAAGMYFARLEAGEYSSVVKMLYLK